MIDLPTPELCEVAIVPVRISIISRALVGTGYITLCRVKHMWILIHRNGSAQSVAEDIVPHYIFALVLPFIDKPALAPIAILPRRSA